MAKTPPIDHRSFKERKAPGGKKAVASPDIAGAAERWWTAEEKDLPGAVYAQVQAIIKNDRTRLADYNVYSRLYGNIPQTQWLAGLAATKASSNNSTPANQQRIAFNLVQSCTDSLTSKIVKTKPQPFFLTSKGDSKVQRKAKKLNEFVKGIFYQNKAYLRTKIAFRDACVWGPGIIHVFGAHGRIYWERVFPYELLVDFLEAHYGPESAKTMHRVKTVDRTTLMAMYPEQKEQIAGLSLTADILAASYRSVSDCITVIESWRLPSAPGKDDGVHCITAQGLCLKAERWDRAHFPFAIMRYSDQLHGFWAQGLAEQLMPIQVELNRCLMSIQKSLYMGGTFKILVHSGSKVVDSHFDNRVGTLIKWVGQIEPKYIIPPMVQPEIYQQVPALKAMGYEQTGISQLSAASLKPAGLDSGKALRESVDIETDRFQAVGQAFEQFHLDLAELSIEEAREMDARGELDDVQVPGKRFVSTVPWKDCDLENDQYVMQCFPISKLPSDPEGRIETITELMEAGIISPEVGRRLLDFPDLDAEENLANAQLDYLHDILDTMAEGGEYIGPEPDDNLDQAMRLGIEYLAVGKRDNLDGKSMAMLRQFIAAVNDLKQQAIAAATPPQGPAPGGGVPMAQPLPPPTSELIPNVNGAAA